MSMKSRDSHKDIPIRTLSFGELLAFGSVIRVFGVLINIDYLDPMVAGFV